MQIRNAKKGFTLVELLLAVGLMAMIIAAVGGGFGYASSMSAFAKNKVTAANHAEKIMEEVRRVTDAVGLSGTGSATDANYWTTWLAAQTAPELAGASSSVSFPNGTGSDPLQILVTVNWSEKNATRTFKLYGLVTPRA